MQERTDQEKVAAALGSALLLAITAFAVWFRFDQLGLKPLHHDEGVNAQFMVSLVDDFKYRYNPTNFHGPLLYFLNYPLGVLRGIDDITMRIMPAVFGSLAVPAMLLFRRKVGWAGVLTGALLIAVAPIEVYFSRTAIHEIYNFTFNLLFVGGFWYWWRSGRRWALVLGAASLACLFATKETTIITVAAVVPSLVAAWLLARPAPSFPGGAGLPERLLDVAPAWWSRRVRRETGRLAGAAQIPWPPEDAPRSVHAASERLQEAQEKVRSAALAVAEAQRVAEAQARAAALPPPPELPWSAKEQLLGPVVPGQGRHWAVRFALVVYGLLVAAAVAVAVSTLQKKYGAELKLPDWTKYAAGGGVAGLLTLLALVVPSDLIWWMRWLVLPFSFLRAAWRHDRWGSRIALGTFLMLLILLFSSFFTHMEGLGKFFQAFFGWGETGVDGSGHEKVWYYWIQSLLWPYYKPLLIVALPALVIGALRRDALAIFTLGWFVLALAAYSAIPYKTPWCVISFSGPLFIGAALAASGVVQLAGRLTAPVARNAVLAVVSLIALGFTAQYTQTSMKIQFEEYDVDYHAFIYVQNLREYFDFTSDVQGIMTTAKEMGLEPKIWMVKARNPLRYYVDGIADAKGSPTWDEKAKAEAMKADLVMANRASANDTQKVMKGLPYEHRWYHERPGQKYDVYIRKPLWDAYVKNAREGKVAPTSKPAQQRTFSDIRSQVYRELEKAAQK